MWQARLRARQRGSERSEPGPGPAPHASVRSSPKVGGRLPSPPLPKRELHPPHSHPPIFGHEGKPALTWVRPACVGYDVCLTAISVLRPLMLVGSLKLTLGAYGGAGMWVPAPHSFGYSAGGGSSSNSGSCTVDSCARFSAALTQGTHMKTLQSSFGHQHWYRASKMNVGGVPQTGQNGHRISRRSPAGWLPMALYGPFPGGGGSLQSWEYFRAAACFVVPRARAIWIHEQPSRRASTTRRSIYVCFSSIDSLVSAISSSTTLIRQH